MTVRIIAALAAAATLAACSSGEAAAPGAVEPIDAPTVASPTPTPTGDTGTGATGEVDLSTIPDEIDEAYVTALAEATAQLYADLAEHTGDDGGLDEVGKALLSQNVVPDERDRILTQFEDAFDGTLEEPAQPFGTALVSVGTASETCTSGVFEITWTGFAGGKYAELDGREFWMIWIGDEGGEGTTAWDLVAIRLNTEGGVTEDPCAA